MIQKVFLREMIKIMKISILFIAFFILVSCSQKGLITNATIHNFRFGVKKELNDQQLGQLKDLLENGLTPVVGAKLIYLRTIKFSYKENKNEIDLLKCDPGFYYLRFNNKHYEVKESYKHIVLDFIEISKEDKDFKKKFWEKRGIKWPFND